MGNTELPLPIRKRLERIEISLSRLEEIRKISLKDFINDWKSQDISLRNFQIAVESCLDIGTCIISRSDAPVPDTYTEIVKTLRKLKVIDENLESEFIKMVRFRNIIVHEYLYIDFNKVYENLRNLSFFRNFARKVIDYIKK